MASIRKRGSKWQVQIRRNGLPAVSRTFIAKDDAVRWARERDRAVDRGESFSSAICDTCQIFLSEIVSRYVREISPSKRGSVDRYQVRPLLQALGQLSLFNLKPAHLTSYRDKRLTEVSSTTVAKEMGLLCHVLKVAADEWGYAIRVELFRGIRKPTLRSGRTRRLEADDAVLILDEIGRCRNRLIRHVFQFALATAMRRGEILSLRWADVDLSSATAYLRQTKNGEPRRVPLSSQAIQTLLTLAEMQNARSEPRQSHHGAYHEASELVFPISANALRLAWERAKKRAGIKDLRFHDLRHEAISRFFEMGLSVPEVALISGHKDPRMLFRYTHLRAENIAQKLAGLDMLKPGQEKV